MRLLWLLYFFSIAWALQGQVMLDIQPDESHPILQKSLKALPSQFPDSATAVLELSGLLQNLRKEGFLESSLDHIQKINDQLKVQLHLGATVL